MTLGCTAALPLVLLGCPAKDKVTDERETAPVVSAPEKVPPAAFSVTPVAAFADAGNIDGLPPFEQAKVYEASGQLWMGRLILERQALGADATKDETELLLKICMQQNDSSCVEACGRKLGRKIKFDGGASASAPSPSASTSASANTGREHREPDTELARVRDLVLKGETDRARKALEPKVLDGKASREEVRLLRGICAAQQDRMCVAVCDTKLK